MNPTEGGQGVTELEALGLTALEAGVYRFLLTESPASGYRIAQALGRPFAGVYKAVESLEGKGAVLVSEEGGTRVVRAVPAPEFLARLEAAYRRGCSAAREALRDAGGESRDERLYRIEDAEQWGERARAGLARASRVVVGSGTPGVVGLVGEALAEVAARGVAVGLKTFAPAGLPGVVEVVDGRGSAALEGGPGEWLMLSIDGRESLEGVFAPGTHELLTGYWTEHPLLCWSLFSGKAAALGLAGAWSALGRGADAGAVADELRRLGAFAVPDSDGKAFMVRRYRGGGRKERDR